MAATLASAPWSAKVLPSKICRAGETTSSLPRQPPRWPPRCLHRLRSRMGPPRRKMVDKGLSTQARAGEAPEPSIGARKVPGKIFAIGGEQAASPPQGEQTRRLGTEERSRNERRERE
ncbi:cyclin-dependent kinase 5 activator 2 [Platysternon megacephalum]|uniref:Cyclin-dependent kinase 5 activator 2 n=1 Tax=Platysternon megacephalum TaxID=55544 RepID=A0A4D9DN47_9SAUR|nr:cyclin-dependent kinase 5 activator 2 [Platysternon megacephalum]